MRLFVAIPLGDETKDRLSAIQHKISSTDIRWTAREQLHVTLKFLGECRETQLPDICRATRSAAELFPPFQCNLEEVGCFPPNGPVRIIWVGVQGDGDSLSQLHREIEARFEKLGFERENRIYHPHVTIGRVKEDRSRGKLRGLITRTSGTELTEQVTEFHLIQSKAAQSGSRYELLERFSLNR